MVYGELLQSTRQVSIYNNILQDTIVSLGLGLIEQVDNGEPDVHSIVAELFRRLAETAELSRSPLVGNAWQNHLLELVLADDNVFAMKAEIAGIERMGESLLSQVRSDLDAMRSLYDIEFRKICDYFPTLENLNPLSHDVVDEARRSIKQRMGECRNWRDFLPELSQYYADYGSGEFGRFRAFRWTKDGEGGRLTGVESPDPIRLTDLVEYDWQRASVKRNTEKLLAGLATNNMLLHGDRGTGKSSTVKAMLNEFGSRKLRLVEVAKENLIDLPEILSILRKRPEKFILFLDDLSFEENETQYKAMKAVLEGGLEARPSNVALYATSNRRNLIRERFSDRSKDEEVHPGDTMQEKLSLSDRFGISVPFLCPDQEEFLRMVGILAERVGIKMTDEVRRQALSWQHARSGRSARQFVDYIAGEIALGK